MTAPAPALAAAQRATFIGSRRMRATRVDTCGRPVYGPKSQVVSSGFISIELSPEVEEGDDYSQKNAGGELVVSDRGPDSIKWFNVSVQFCQVDPDLFAIMNPTWKPVTNAIRTQSTGFRVGQKLSGDAGFALELWPKASGAGAACLGDSDTFDEDFEVGGYFLLPWIVGNAPDSWTFENSTTTFTLRGRSRVGSLWGHGPYKITRGEDGAPAVLLDPIDPGFDVPAWDLQSSLDPDHVHAEIVTVRPPAPVAGAQPLWNTNATAPQITVTGSGTALTADLSVTNFDQVGGFGTVHWGDGVSEPVPSSSAGQISHTYTEPGTYTIQFTAGNFAPPVTSEFEATAPAGATTLASRTSTASTKDTSTKDD